VTRCRGNLPCLSCLRSVSVSRAPRTPSSTLHGQPESELRKSQYESQFIPPVNSYTQWKMVFACLSAKAGMKVLVSMNFSLIKHTGQQRAQRPLGNGNNLISDK